MLPPLHCFGYCYQLLILYGHTIQNVKIHFSHRPFVVGAFVWFYSPQYCCYLIFFLLFLLYCRICFGQLYNIQLLLFYIRTHCWKFLLAPAATQPQYCHTQQQMNIKQNKKNQQQLFTRTYGIWCEPASAMNRNRKTGNWSLKSPPYDFECCRCRLRGRRCLQHNQSHELAYKHSKSAAFNSLE